VVLDLFSRQVVGWAMDAQMPQELTLAALDMAVQRRRPLPGCMHHSDRGSQYAAGDYQKKWAEHGMVCSMSRKGNCWDNAPMESFFHSLKTEQVHHRDYQTRDEARRDIFEYIEVFYNRQRRHSTLGYLSPAQFELAALAA
jgi:putative transposase